MRFLFAISHRTGGGAERVLSLFSSTLAEQGHDVHLLQKDFSQHDYPISERVKVIAFGEQTVSGGVLKRKLHRIKRYRQVIREVKPDVVMPFLGSVVTDTFFATLFTKSIFVSTVRNNPAVDPPNRVSRWGRNMVNFFSHAVFVQNEDQRAYYPEFMRHRIFAVPNPISPEYLSCVQRAPGEIVRCVASGRLAQQKNHRLLIDAFVLAHEKCPQLQLAIFGEGTLREQLQAQIDGAGAQAFIALPGRTDDMREELERADMYILSSDYEGMPNALMEAMAVGLPCISTDCPTGPADLIVDGENGILVPMGDVQAMCSAICRLANAPEQAHSMGVLAQQFIQTTYAPSQISAELAVQCQRFIKGGTNQ